MSVKTEYRAAYSAFYLLQGGFVLELFFDPEDGGDIFLRNIC
jgi:hypothetical protein